MIVKSIDKLGGKSIDPASLYRVYTNAWIHRDKWRNVLQAKEKLEFLTAVARNLWSRGESKVHYTELNEYLRSRLATKIRDPVEMIEVDSEVRTASFLVRDENGNYGFAHKSYAEYFVARYTAGQLHKGDLTCLDSARMTPEIVVFIYHMLDRLADTEDLLNKILTSEYHPRVSENALLLSYGIKKAHLLHQGFNGVLRIQMCSNADLTGAQLEGVKLEGMVLPNARAHGAVLRNAVLSGACLHASDLTRCDLSEANLNGADLSEANLTGAICVDCLLEGGNLSSANLKNAKFSGSNLRSARWDGAALEGVVGLPIHRFLEEITAVRSSHGDPARHAQKPEQDTSELMARVAPIVAAYARTSGASREDAQEIEGMALEQLLIGLRDEHIQMDAVETAARSIVKYTSRRLLASSRRSIMVSQEDVEVIGESFPAAVVGDAEAAIDVKRTIELIDSLFEERTVQILNLSIQGFTAKEIAEELGLNANAVSQRLHRARRRLAAELAGDEE